MENKKEDTVLVVIHEHPDYAQAAADIMAREWNHKETMITRNIESMKAVPISGFPCHLGFLLSTEDCKYVFIGHAKLTKADGRSDGSCCILYSLVIDLPHRGLGYGRAFMEKIEHFVAKKGISYIYLFTPDKVAFYQHLGYKESEEVSSLGQNAKRLNSKQIANLEGLFAKRLNVTSATGASVWLRKRLIFESPDFLYKKPEKVLENLLKRLLQVFSNESTDEKCCFSALMINIPFQQQVGPSCGVAALNMVFKYIGDNNIECANSNNNVVRCKDCSTNPTKNVQSKCYASAVEMSIDLRISYDGELFCTNNFVFLAQEYWKKKLIVKDISNETFYDIVHSLLVRCLPVFIPYDRNLGDHTPGLFDGKHAHWTTLHGIILKDTLINDLCEKFSKQSRLLKDNVELDLIKLSPDMSSTLNKEKVKGILEGEIYFVCSHGMSEKSFISTYENLLLSNSQLNQCKTNIYLAGDSLFHLRSKIVFFA